MKKIIPFIAACFIALTWACVGPNLQKANSGLVITAPDGYAVNCNSGYVRLYPHYCDSTSSPLGFVNLNGTCLAFSSIVVNKPITPSNATALLMNISPTFSTAAAVAARTISFTIFKDNTCGTPAISPSMSMTAYEFVATAATPFAVLSYLQMIAQKNVGTADMWYIGSVTNCVGCSLGISIKGYYD